MYSLMFKDHYDPKKCTKTQCFKSESKQTKGDYYNKAQ